MAGVSNALGRDLESPLGDMPNPTGKQLVSPQFHEIWGVIKSWDINVPEYYDGYCGANGSHVALILNALQGRN